jgi:hypothetical protein
MLTQSRIDVRWRLLSLCFLLIIVISCGTRDDFIGTYKAASSGSPKQAEMEIELKANGAGIWRVSDEEVPFVWYVKGGELRVNTKGGGVIVGAVEKDTIHISLPGTNKMVYFRRTH